MSNDDNQVTRDRLKIIVRHATHDQDEVIFLLIHELWYRGIIDNYTSLRYLTVSNCTSGHLY